MFGLLKNRRGSSLLGSLVVMVVLASAAASIVTLSGNDSQASNDDVQYSQAFQVGNGGLQYALDKLNKGLSPNVTDKSFGLGTFTVTTDPSSSLITVVAKVGNATTTQSINADFSYNCIYLDVSQAIADDFNLRGVKLVKTCNEAAILEKVVVTWNWSECAMDVGCQEEGGGADDDPYGPYRDPNNPSKVLICHVPPGNPGNKHTLSVSESGWENGHKGGTGKNHNMDYLGNCDGESADDAIEVYSCQYYSDVADDLDNCEESDSGATIDQIDLASVPVFQVGSIPYSDASSASSGDEINIEDAILGANGSYSFDFQFSDLIPAGGWYEMTAVFSDGSELYGRFRAGNAVTESSGVVTQGFQVENGVVIVEPEYQVDLEILGSAITCGDGGPEVNVRAELCVDNSCSDLWGYTDLDGGELYTTINSDQNTEYKIRANAYLDSCNNFSATHASTNTLQVKTLTLGEQSPPLAGFGGQQSVQQFLSAYLDDNGRVVINENQVIMLFELGVDMGQTPGSTAADFQDLVVLMSVTQVQ